MDKPRSISNFLKALYRIWITERPNQLAAALAYYGMFSFAPVIYIAFTVAGIFFDQLSLMDEVYARLEKSLGAEIAGFIQDAVVSVSQTTQGGTMITSLISFLALLLAASGMFFQLQFALNTIWKVTPPKKGETRALVRQRLFSFLMVICVGLFLVVATLAGIIRSWIGSWLNPGGLETSSSVGLLIMLAAISFALIYKVLPDVEIAWRDVWIGAIVAALLVTIGGWLVIYYLGSSRFGSAFEAAGAFAIILIGIYYIAQIFLFGAVLTRVYAHTYGSMRQSATEADQGE